MERNWIPAIFPQFSSTNGVINMDIFLEGDFIELTDASIFEVKGFIHPKGKVVALPRYIPKNHPAFQKLTQEVREKWFFPQLRTRKYIEKGEIQFQEGYFKVLGLKEKFEVLCEFFPEIEVTHPRRDFLLPSVPLSLVKRHFKPEKLVRDLFYPKQWYNDQNNNKNPPNNGKIWRDATELIRVLTERVGVEPKNLGISGSLLVGLEDDDSDLDLVVYGRIPGYKIRKALFDIFSHSCIETKKEEIRPYTTEELISLYKKRVPAQHYSLQRFIQMEQRKLHQGYFRNREFFIRYLENEKREDNKDYEEDFGRIYNIGRIKIHAQVVGDENWWLTPSIVHIGNVKVLDTPYISEKNQELLKRYNLRLEDVCRTFSLRGRFTENVRLLEDIEAEGMLELVESEHPSKEPQAFLQISLGSHPNDLLLPR